MKKILLSTIALASILLLSEPILAAGASVNTRIKTQEFRIQKGCDKGQITNREEFILRKEHKKIKKMIKRLMQSHPVSLKNKKKIHSILNRASLNIFKKRYNAQSKAKEHSK